MITTNWHTIENQNDIEDIIKRSSHSPLLIFKHSTRCSISSIVRDRFTKELANLKYPVQIHLIDVIRHREVSNEIARHFNVRHESPQILKIEQGKCTFNTSHFDISINNLPDLPVG